MDYLGMTTNHSEVITSMYHHNATTPLDYDDGESLSLENVTESPVDRLDCTVAANWEHTITNWERASTAPVLLVLLLLPNALVMGVMGRSVLKSRRLSSPRLLVACSAMVDFLYGATSTLPQTLKYWVGYCRAGGPLSCQLQGFSSVCFGLASTLLVVSMATERFCAMRLPFKYDTIFQPRNTFVLCLAINIYSLAVASLPLMGVGRYSFGGLGCDFDYADQSRRATLYVYFRVLQGFLLIVLLVGLNIIVLMELKRMKSLVHHAPATSQASHHDMSRSASGLQSRFVALVLMTSIVFIICNTPYLVRMIQLHHGVANPAVKNYQVKRMFFSNGILNPLLCLLFLLTGSRKCRACLLAILTCGRPLPVDLSFSDSTLANSTQGAGDGQQHNGHK